MTSEDIKPSTHHHQRPESPTVTLTWHACKYKVHKLHQRYILLFGISLLLHCYALVHDKNMAVILRVFVRDINCDVLIS